MGIKDALLKTAKTKLTKFLNNVELNEDEDLSAIVMTAIGEDSYLKVVALKQVDGKLVIARTIDGVSLGDIL
tara:strand:+ start:8603 stop:8818 length:216 start_codon:yes stop_codon:yes gene_type:complete